MDRTSSPSPAETCAREIHNDWADQEQDYYEPDVVWLAKTIQRLLDSEVQRTREEYRELARKWRDRIKQEGFVSNGATALCASEIEAINAEIKYG